MHKFINKSLVMLCLSFLFLATSCAPSLVDRVKGLQKARNRQDVEKELSFYTEDTRFEVIGAGVIEGKEELRKALEHGAILNGKANFTDLKVSRETVTCKLKEQNDWLKAAGIDATYYEPFQFTFKNGLIKECRVKPAQETVRVYKEFWASFEKWACEKRPRELAELKAIGWFTTSKENVTKWLALTREWREAFEKWASEKRPQELAELKSKGEYITKENVGKWSALQREWGEAMLVERVKALEKAYNRQNVEKVLSLCTDDVRWETVGFGEMEGKEQFRRDMEQTAILNQRVVLTDLKVSGDTVTGKVKAQDDWHKAGGIDAVYGEIQFTFENGLLKEARAKPTQESAKALEELASFWKWASEKRGQELAELKSVTKENVGKWLALVRQWREEREKEK